MKSSLIHSTVAAVALLASPLLAHAQGTSGSTGAIASIPSSVLRHEPGQPVTQPGILGLIFGTPQPAPDVDSRQKSTPRGQNPLPSR
jgi:hypothetical protein